MSSSAVPALLAVALQLGLGVAVFLANPKRRSNQGFLILSGASLAWLLSLGIGSSTNAASVAVFCIREASAAGALYLLSLNLLRLSIRHGESNWSEILRRSRAWLIATLAVILFCQTPLFLRGVRMAGGPPTPVYGNGGYLYLAFLIVGFVVVLTSYVNDVKETVGSQRSELAFVLIGGIAAILFALVVSLALVVLIGEERAILFAPFRAFLFTAVIGYGMVTKKIMDVSLFVRRIISYSLLATYLLALYAAVWWLAKTALSTQIPARADELGHVIAALAVAFAMAPARGVSRRLAERLFISSNQLDFRSTVSKATDILSSITTLQDLLQRFGGTIAEAMGAESVYILLPERDGYHNRFAYARTGEPDTACFLALDDPIVDYLKGYHEPLVLAELQRRRPTSDIRNLVERMAEKQLALAAAIFSRDHLAGIMFLGPRASGQIYGSVEQNALTVLCGQLAVAIDNAQLFTEVQNARIYNETLLHNLTTGVIAAGVDERITVFNNEAGQIIQEQPDEVLDRSVHILPDPIRLALCGTLRSGQGHNTEITLQAKNKEDGITARISTAIFRGQDNAVLGALMVLTDVTALKRLEQQIRRSDRLASLGTLSAGMAHEIKNPLVSIKTFAQLLPERYNDSDFRDTFSNLIGHEIDRIDSLVNQLLRFARPAKPHLQPSHVHSILEKSLLLVGHRLYQKDVKLSRSWEANVDTIRADADQLEQVFLNFFINAMDAMTNGGELSISTEVLSAQEWVSHLSDGGNGSDGEVLRITIRDNGEGIPKENLAHVFDPFFTTKDYGTGLGLSVVHGIIQEHGGQIEVESELNKGTAFHILLPLVRFGSEVVAA